MKHQGALHPNIALTVVPATNADGDLLGKSASDLQTNIIVTNNKIKGTLKYIADYTSAGYVGDEASGNYLALKCTSINGATITVEVVGGVHGAQTLDSDGLVICRIANTSQKIKVVASKNGQSTTKTYSLTGLTLTPEG